MADKPPLILASGSAARRTMLTSAGLEFSVVPTSVDEGALRDALSAENPRITPVQVAEALAVEKARTVSQDHTDALVIGGDQVLALEGEIFEKPPSLADARRSLQRLRAKEHFLHSAVVLAEAGQVTWIHTDTAFLRMRDFSDAALDAYLEVAGRDVCQCVGAYMIEGPAIQLFERVVGDYFTILGLPLVPLLGELTLRGVVRP
jgi:nucleoside triphosphate pyrophosphatase